MILTTKRIAPLVLMLTLATAGCADVSTSKGGYYTHDHLQPHVPGTVMTDRQIDRQLREDGYMLQGSPHRLGAVVFANAQNTRGDHNCLVLNAFSGTVLQRLHAGPNGYVAEIGTAPGPGYAGFPAAPLPPAELPCDPHVPAPDLNPPMIPGVPPQLLRMRY